MKHEQKTSNESRRQFWYHAVFQMEFPLGDKGDNDDDDDEQSKREIEREKGLIIIMFFAL